MQTHRQEVQHVLAWAAIACCLHGFGNLSCMVHGCMHVTCAWCDKMGHMGHDDIVNRLSVWSCTAMHLVKAPALQACMGSMELSACQMQCGLIRTLYLLHSRGALGGRV